MSTIVLTGGGTAGHVTACLALIDRLKNDFDRFVYIGSHRGMERELVKAYPHVVYYAIDCIKLRRSLSPKNLAIPFVLARGTRQARRILRAEKPDVIFSKGGYVSLPVVRAAGRIPVVLHESDRTMGLANRLARRKATILLSSFPLKSCTRTGSPLRPSLYRGSAAAARARFGLTKPVLLVTGGSLGAARLNACVRNALPVLTRSYDVVHLTGKGKRDPNVIAPGYVQIEYEQDPADLFACADLVITRGGANTLFELAALKKPMLVVPLGTASRGDQIENATYFVSHGLARKLLEPDLTPDTLCAAVRDLALAAPMLRDALSRFDADGTDAVAAHVLRTAGKL